MTLSWRLVQGFTEGQAAPSSRLGFPINTHMMPGHIIALRTYVRAHMREPPKGPFALMLLMNTSDGSFVHGTILQLAVVQGSMTVFRH